MKIIRKKDGILKTINALKNPQPFLEEAGQILQANTIARILFTKQSPDGTAWPAWATSTMRARQRKGNAAQGLLHDTGALSQSIRYEVRGKQVIVGSSGLMYARFLQEGTMNMPARPFIGISRKDRGELRAALAAYLRKEVQ